MALNPTQIELPPGVLCQRCRCRDQCPCVRDAVVRCAARQVQSDAVRLAGEADRLDQAISQSENVCCLLEADRRAVELLDRMLCQSLSLIQQLRDCVGD